MISLFSFKSFLSELKAHHLKLMYSYEDHEIPSMSALKDIHPSITMSSFTDLTSQGMFIIIFNYNYMQLNAKHSLTCRVNKKKRII